MFWLLDPGQNAVLAARPRGLLLPSPPSPTVLYAAAPQRLTHVEVPKRTRPGRVLSRFSLVRPATHVARAHAAAPLRREGGAVKCAGVGAGQLSHR
eukprot:gene18573-biopygen5429